MLTIYHNPRCTKSRQTLELIEKSGTAVKIIKYLEEIPTPDELRGLTDKLGITAEQLVRKGEAVYKEEYKGKSLSDEEWILAMAANPKLIERPVVVKGDQAILGRPPENVLALL